MAPEKLPKDGVGTDPVTTPAKPSQPTDPGINPPKQPEKPEQPGINPPGGSPGGPVSTQPVETPDKPTKPVPTDPPPAKPPEEQPGINPPADPPDKSDIVHAAIVGEQAPLHLCNLVAGGKSVGEAIDSIVKE